MVVCAGYTATYEYLLKLVGIESYSVINNDHAWNLVKLDGEYYHVDVTWDDPTPDKPGRVRCKHLFCSDAVFYESHTDNAYREKYGNDFL